MGNCLLSGLHIICQLTKKTSLKFKNVICKSITTTIIYTYSRKIL